VSSISSTGFDTYRPLFVAFALAAGACTGPMRQPALPDVAELTAVPFFAQTEFHCGPAALATVMNAAAVAVTPEELVDAVYIEGLQGTLQAELLAATRRHGLLPVPVEEDPERLLAEVASGRPVLVLQNLGFARAPLWHYAVVVGFDAGTSRFVLRSGEERRRLERAARFLRTWRLGGHWAFVAVVPGEIPVTAAAGRYMRALVDSEHVLTDASVAAAYAAALARWPNESVVAFLAGARAHAGGDLTAAARHYRRALALEPRHAAGRNNLAHVLLAQGCRAEALSEARAALALTEPEGDFHAEILDTVRAIESSPTGSPERSVCAPG